MRPRWVPGVSLAALALAAFPVHAQTVIGAKSGVINWVEGDAFLGDKPYVMQPSQFGEVKENMVFRTEEGRAEILLPPGVFFRMGEKASFKMISNRLIDTRVELLTGSAVLEIDDIAKEASVTVVCKEGTVTLSKAGLYRFDVEPAQIKVYKGSAARAGVRSDLAAGCTAPPRPSAARSGVLRVVQQILEIAEVQPQIPHVRVRLTRGDRGAQQSAVQAARARTRDHVDAHAHAQRGRERPVDRQRRIGIARGQLRRRIGIASAQCIDLGTTPEIQIARLTPPSEPGQDAVRPDRRSSPWSPSRSSTGACQRYASRPGVAQPA